MKVLIDSDSIKSRVKEIAATLKNKYRDKKLVILIVLKGAFVFGSDLIRELSELDIVVDFIRASSYGYGTESCGDVNIIFEPSVPIEGESVLIVDDILDTGYTLSKIVDYVYSKGPKECEICVLLDKPERRKVEVKVDYVGFKIPNYFVFGYGIDWAEKYRNLPFIAYNPEIT